MLMGALRSCIIINFLTRAYSRLVTGLSCLRFRDWSFNSGSKTPDIEDAFWSLTSTPYKERGNNSFPSRHTKRFLPGFCSCQVYKFCFIFDKPGFIISIQAARTLTNTSLWTILSHHQLHKSADIYHLTRHKNLFLCNSGYFYCNLNQIRKQTAWCVNVL